MELQNGPVKYTYRYPVIEAMRMPLEPDIEAVDAVAEWVQRGVVDACAEAKTWDDLPPGPVTKWYDSYLDIDFVRAYLGDYVVRVGDTFSVVGASVFEGLFQAIPQHNLGFCLGCCENHTRADLGGES